ncbi:MAG: ImmA/IrrE family metallo-endopeptidase [Bacteriovoracia bacterium]
MNLNVVKEKINEKFQSVERFADELLVSRRTVYNWFESSKIPSDRVMQVVNLLQLQQSEIDLLFQVPQTQLFFRKKGKKEPSQDIFSRCKSLAETFFKIDGASHLVRDGVFLGTSDKSPVKVAAYLRSLLSLGAQEPATLTKILSEIRKHNISIFFMPFSRMGFAFENGSNREVAFTAKRENQVIVFVDSERVVDSATFDIGHELAHIIFNDPSGESNDHSEKSCDKVAQLLLYPHELFLLQKSAFECFLDAKKFSWTTCLSAFCQLRLEYDWSPMGLALALSDYGLIKSKGHEFNRLMKMDSHLKKSLKNYDNLYFEKFVPEDYEKLTEFFNTDIYRDKEVLKPFIEIRNAAAFGQISPRRFAGDFGVHVGDADELVKFWRFTEEDSEPQDAVNDQSDK